MSATHDELLVHSEISLARHHEDDTAVGITCTCTATSEAALTAFSQLTESGWLQQMTFGQSSSRFSCRFFNCPQPPGSAR